jgi:hypothetical protein
MTSAPLLRPADPADVADALAYALRYDGNRRVHHADDVRHFTGRQIPFTERGGTENKTSGLTADLNAKANRDSSMPIKREPSEAVYDAVPQDPCDKVRAILLEPQLPAM